LNPFGLLSGGKCKGAGDIHKMLKKAKEIEDKRKGFAA
jgi:quinone-modifying oxidoreductase subunit QmoC